MSDLYRYAAGGEVYELLVSPYESHLLAQVERVGAAPGPPSATVFAVHKQGQVVRAPHAELLKQTEALATYFERNRELLQYRYSIETRGKTGESEGSGGGGSTCVYQGQHAMAEAGPGFCCITTSEKEMVTIGRGRQAVRFKVTTLVDMRDMKPVTLDDGTRLIPRRRKRPTHLEEGLRGLAAFLKSHVVDEVEQSGIENADRTGMAGGPHA